MWHGLAAMCVTKVERCPSTINPTWVTDMTWPPEELLPSCSALNEPWFGLAAYWLASGSHLMTRIETDPAWTPFWIVCSPSFLKPSSLIEKPVCVIQSVIATCLWITFAVAWRDQADSGPLTNHSRASLCSENYRDSVVCHCLIELVSHRAVPFQCFWEDFWIMLMICNLLFTLAPVSLFHTDGTWAWTGEKEILGIHFSLSLSLSFHTLTHTHMHACTLLSLKETQWTWALASDSHSSNFDFWLSYSLALILWQVL